MLRRHNRNHARVAAIGVLILMLSWLIVSRGVANHLAQQSPALALEFQSNNTEALDARAAQLIGLEGSTSDQVVGVAAEAAKQSLSRDATSAVAYRVLGFGYDARGEKQHARTLIRFASSCSRRDLSTQLWMINELVSQDDANGALVHFDAALRTSTIASSILFPVLVNASVEPSLIGPIASVLNRKPAWANDFLSLVVENGQNEANISRLLASLHPKTGMYTVQLADQFIRRLYREGNASEALALYRLKGDRTLFPNGDFSHPARDVPFQWQASTLSDRSSWHDSIANGENVLSFSTVPSAEGPIGSQHLVLAPGHYQLSYLTGRGRWDGLRPPYVTLRCDSSTSVVLRQAMAPNGLHRKEFDVAPECTKVLFEIIVQTQADQEGLEGWIDKVSIIRVDRIATDRL